MTLTGPLKRPGSARSSSARYKEIEDRAVDQAIAMQEGAGLDVVSDGELRRHSFIDQLIEAVEGLTRSDAQENKLRLVAEVANQVWG